MIEDQEAPHVLVVDDEPDIISVVCAGLEDEGIRARGCTQAAEAFWFIQRAPPSLVILDVRMPGMDGIELLRHLRSDARTAGLPILFLTANAEQLRQRLPNFAELGAHLMAKPFELEPLLRRVHKILATHDGGYSTSHQG